MEEAFLFSLDVIQRGLQIIRNLRDERLGREMRSLVISRDENEFIDVLTHLRVLLKEGSEVMDWPTNDVTIIETLVLELLINLPLHKCADITIETLNDQNTFPRNEKTADIWIYPINNLGDNKVQFIPLLRQLVRVESFKKRLTIDRLVIEALEILKEVEFCEFLYKSDPDTIFKSMRNSECVCTILSKTITRLRRFISVLVICPELSPAALQLKDILMSIAVSASNSNSVSEDSKVSSNSFVVELYLKHPSSISKLPPCIMKQLRSSVSVREKSPNNKKATDTSTPKQNENTKQTQSQRMNIGRNIIDNLMVSVLNSISRIDKETKRANPKNLSKMLIGSIKSVCVEDGNIQGKNVISQITSEFNWKLKHMLEVFFEIEDPRASKTFSILLNLEMERLKLTCDNDQSTNTLITPSILCQYIVYTASRSNRLYNSCCHSLKSVIPLCFSCWGVKTDPIPQKQKQKTEHKDSLALLFSSNLTEIAGTISAPLNRISGQHTPIALQHPLVLRFIMEGLQTIDNSLGSDLNSTMLSMLTKMIGEAFKSAEAFIAMQFLGTIRTVVGFGDAWKMAINSLSSKAHGNTTVSAPMHKFLFANSLTRFDIPGLVQYLSAAISSSSTSSSTPPRMALFDLLMLLALVPHLGNYVDPEGQGRRIIVGALNRLLTGSLNESTKMIKDTLQDTILLEVLDKTKCVDEFIIEVCELLNTGGENVTDELLSSPVVTSLALPAFIKVIVASSGQLVSPSSHVLRRYASDDELSKTNTSYGAFLLDLVGRCDAEAPGHVLKQVFTIKAGWESEVLESVDICDLESKPLMSSVLKDNTVIGWMMFSNSVDTQHPWLLFPPHLTSEGLVRVAVLGFRALDVYTEFSAESGARVLSDVVSLLFYKYNVLLCLKAVSREESSSLKSLDNCFLVWDIGPHLIYAVATDCSKSDNEAISSEYGISELLDSYSSAAVALVDSMPDEKSCKRMSEAKRQLVKSNTKLGETLREDQIYVKTNSTCNCHLTVTAACFLLLVTNAVARTNRGRLITGKQIGIPAKLESAFRNLFHVALFGLVNSAFVKQRPTDIPSSGSASNSKVSVSTATESSVLSTDRVYLIAHPVSVEQPYFNRTEHSDGKSLEKYATPEGFPIVYGFMGIRPCTFGYKLGVSPVNDEVILPDLTTDRMIIHSAKDEYDKGLESKSEEEDEEKDEEEKEENEYVQSESQDEANNTNLSPIYTGTSFKLLFESANALGALLMMMDNRSLSRTHIAAFLQLIIAAATSVRHIPSITKLLPCRRGSNINKKAIGMKGVELDKLIEYWLGLDEHNIYASALYEVSTAFFGDILGLTTKKVLFSVERRSGGLPRLVTVLSHALYCCECVFTLCSSAFDSKLASTLLQHVALSGGNIATTMKKMSVIGSDFGSIVNTWRATSKRERENILDGKECMSEKEENKKDTTMLDHPTSELSTSTSAFLSSTCANALMCSSLLQKGTVLSGRAKTMYGGDEMTFSVYSHHSCFHCAELVDNSNSCGKQDPDSWYDDVEAFWDKNGLPEISESRIASSERQFVLGTKDSAVSPLLMLGKKRAFICIDKVAKTDSAVFPGNTDIEGKELSGLDGIINSAGLLGDLIRLIHIDKTLGYTRVVFNQGNKVPHDTIMQLLVAINRGTAMSDIELISHFGSARAATYVMVLATSAILFAASSSKSHECYGGLPSISLAHMIPIRLSPQPRVCSTIKNTGHVFLLEFCFSLLDSLTSLICGGTVVSVKESSLLEALGASGIEDEEYDTVVSSQTMEEAFGVLHISVQEFFGQEERRLGDGRPNTNNVGHLFRLIDSVRSVLSIVSNIYKFNLPMDIHSDAEKDALLFDGSDDGVPIPNKIAKSIASRFSFFDKLFNSAKYLVVDINKIEYECQTSQSGLRELLVCIVDALTEYGNIVRMCRVFNFGEFDGIDFSGPCFPDLPQILILPWYKMYGGLKKIEKGSYSPEHIELLHSMVEAGCLPDITSSHNMKTLVGVITNLNYCCVLMDRQVSSICECLAKAFYQKNILNTKTKTTEDIKDILTKELIPFVRERISQTKRRNEDNSSLESYLIALMLLLVDQRKVGLCVLSDTEQMSRYLSTNGITYYLRTSGILDNVIDKCSSSSDFERRNEMLRVLVCSFMANERMFDSVMRETKSHFIAHRCMGQLLSDRMIQKAIYTRTLLVEMISLFLEEAREFDESHTNELNLYPETVSLIRSLNNIIVKLGSIDETQRISQPIRIYEAILSAYPIAIEKIISSKQEKSSRYKEVIQPLMIEHISFIPDVANVFECSILPQHQTDYMLYRYKKMMDAAMQNKAK